MILFNIMSIFIVVCYLIGSILMFYGVSSHKEKIRSLGSWVSIAGFIVHTVLVVAGVIVHSFDDLTSRYFMQLFSWSCFFVYLIGRSRLKSSFLSLTTTPFTLILFLVSFQFENMEGRLPLHFGEIFFVAHIGAFFVSLGFLTMAFGAAIMFLHMESRIKSKSPLSEIDKEMPALSYFDRINKMAVLWGMPLYTIGLAAGILGAPLVWGKAVAWDLKDICAILVWFLYAFLFHQRLVKGWRGRKAAILVIIIFAVSLFSLLGVNLFLPTRHGSVPML